MSEEQRPRRWRLRRWLAIGAVSVAVLLLVGFFFIGRYLRAAVRAEELEALINESLGPATDGLYTASVGVIDLAT